MKKLFALILSLVMMTALTVPALAAAYDLEDEIPAIPVTGVYAVVDDTNVYSVDIDWSSMEFTYTETKTWNPATDEQDGYYTVNDDGKWSTTGGVVTVTNKSNKAIVANLTYTPTAEFDGVISGSFDNATISLDDALTEPQVGTAKLTLSGKLASDKGGTLGNITISLAAAPQ